MYLGVDCDRHFCIILIIETQQLTGDNEMTNNMRKKIGIALTETRRYIAKESARADDLRPAEIQELLEKYKAHEQKLLGMLNGTVATP